ncbi:MAG: (d)CMP kinase [Ignavibacteriales bacterium]|nr:(d)CMP kinase [Ignavibacteriales bacterium]
MRKIVIAIDGPAGAGKSSTAKLVAKKLGYIHVDTGAMYRAITVKVLEEGILPGDRESVSALARRSEIRLEISHNSTKVFIDGRDVTHRIRTGEVTKSVSSISSIPDVREVLVREQRKMAASGGVVLEGRDIGTVVLPDADLKVFMVANVTERARRRKKELAVDGVEVDEQSLTTEIEERDRKDSTRDASPLKQAKDAFVLDTSDLSLEEQANFIVQKAKEILRRKKL